jgi:hypothetical protein
MSLIIRETVVTECQGLARNIESAVRNSTSNPLEDSVIEKICESHVKRIVEDAGKQIEKQVEELEYQREDQYKLQQSTEMYDNKKADITEIVNVRINRRGGSGISDPDFYQLNGYLHNLNTSDKASLEALDPYCAIEVIKTNPNADIDDVDDSDLLQHDSHSEFWEDYQTLYDIEVEEPLDKFYDCNQKIVKLLGIHCKSHAEIVRILGILSVHGDYSGVINIKLLYDLALLLAAKSNEEPIAPESVENVEGVESVESVEEAKNPEMNKRRKTDTLPGGEETVRHAVCSFGNVPSSNDTSSDDDTIPLSLVDNANEEKEQNETNEATISYFNIDQYGSYFREATDSAEFAIDEEKDEVYVGTESGGTKKRKRT